MAPSSGPQMRPTPPSTRITSMKTSMLSLNDAGLRKRMSWA